MSSPDGNDPKDEPTLRIGIFGGSFDPIHRGHLEMAEKARVEAELDRVIFVPCFVSPFKEATAAPAEERAEWIGLSINDLGFDEWATVSRFEIDRHGPSYSWETVQHFRKQERAEWFWLLGADQWDVIEKWAESDRLREWLQFLVFTRDGTPVAERAGWRHRAIEFHHPASSTEIRENLEGSREWLTRSVFEACGTSGVYK